QTWMPAVCMKYTNGNCTASWQPSSWIVYQPAYGVISATMDVNGVWTTTSYDDQGRMVNSASAGEAPVSISYAPRLDAYIHTTNGMIVTATQAGQTLTSASDADGRTLLSSHIGFDGTVINDSKMTYDTFGRVLTVSQPYYQGNTPLYQTSYQYDGLSRLL